ncbi:hypothetical protein PGT21_036306 [Puccinia graminis f. sp. tritici]|uniref:Uncharacterized protein n=1 Tax=Puccinia graminis f. sp. tritici TaxID=56615 RepID=A0A5B0PAC2_PUCGR|nr:hypothetical protein PGT21_036306 [Puccinia graminis f. sp. tritici]KAA1100376.1 hypothetical protein PGTUg99_024331 [Puccinia graminis f. sp. tritici]
MATNDCSSHTTQLPQPAYQTRGQLNRAEGPSRFPNRVGREADCGVQGSGSAGHGRRPLPVPPPRQPCSRTPGPEDVKDVVPEVEWRTTKPLFSLQASADVASERMCSSASNYSQPSNDNYNSFKQPAPSWPLNPIRQSLIEPESDWIPAKNVFSPRAAPLLLPALDQLIKQNTPTEFSQFNPHDLSPQELKMWVKTQRSTGFHPPRIWHQRFGLAWIGGSWRSKQKLTTQEADYNSALVDEKEAILNNPSSTHDAARSQSNEILLPMHLLDSKLLKPITNSDESSDNPALTLLNFIPDFSRTTPHHHVDQQPTFSHRFLILAHLENFRDFLQFIGLVGGFYGSRVNSSSSSAQTIISKLPIFQRVYPHQSFLNYPLLLFQWIPGLLSFDLTSFFGYSSALMITIYSGFLLLVLYEFYFLTGGWKGPRRRATSSKVEDRPSNCRLDHPMSQKKSEGHELPEFLVTDSPTASSNPLMLSFLRWRKIRNCRNTSFYSITITLLLLSLYVPVTRMCIDGLVWGNNYWPIENVYISHQDQHMSLTENSLGEPLGSLTTPIEFCYRTAVKKHEFEARGLVLFQSIILLLLFSCWFPFRFYNVIAACSDHLRNRRDQTHHTLNNLESHRNSSPVYGSGLLERFSYFNHAYKQDDNWAPARDIISRFLTKLIIIFLTTIPVKDNCIFIKRWETSRYLIDLMRFLFLSFAFLLVWIFQSIWKPYRFKSLNMINDLNIKFCLFLGVVGLGSVFIHFQELLFGSIALIWTTIMYLLNIHYLAIHSTTAKRLLSNFNHKLDIDKSLFSADFDFQKEVIRRVWHESLCVLLLGMPDFRIGEGKTLQWREEVPGAPYLANFEGTHGERLVENLKLLRALGASKYRQASQPALQKDQSDEKTLSIQRIIRSDFTGPDCFWKPHNAADLEGVTTFFGRADVIPFPFTVIFKYDQRLAPVCISRLGDLRAFVAQNQNPQVRMRRKVRLIFRALENKQVFAPLSLPWETVQTIKGERRPRWFQIRARSDVNFRSGVLKIYRNCQNKWQGYNFNSGFQVSIQYKDGQSIKSNGSTISRIHHTRLPRSLGLRDDFKVTPILAKLFQDNHSIINTTLEKVERALGSHRSYFSRQAAWKQNRMSFSFLEVFFQGQNHISSNALRSKLESHLLLNEVDQQLRRLPQICRGSLQVMEERMERINKSKLNQWWFVIFDDIYRRNYKILNRLSTKPEDFSPYHRGSVCYKPMIRSDLEKFLMNRNVFQPDWELQDGEQDSGHPEGANYHSNHPVFHPGFLNQLYFHLDLFLFKELDENAEELKKSGNSQDNWLPRSKLYQGVYEIDRPYQRDRNLLTRLKDGLKKWLLLEEPFRAAQEETDDEGDDLEKSEQGTRHDRQSEQLIKLGPTQNFSKLDKLPNQIYKEMSDYDAGQDTARKKAPAAFSGTNSNSDRSTYVHSSDGHPSDWNISSHDSATGYDITDDLAFNSNDSTAETDSTIYGFH